MFLSLLALLLYLHLTSSLHLPQFLRSPTEHILQPATDTKATSKPHPVQLEAHIMSKCPDAKDCLHNLLIPAMSQLPPHSINLTLSYIGTSTPDDDGVACMHGPTECLGNILQLCAAHEYPEPKQWLGFAACTTERYAEIPERKLIEQCAAEYGMEFERLNGCASRDDGQFGLDLLKGSVDRSRSLGVKISCTVSVLAVL
jgi:hypothetical protein